MNKFEGLPIGCPESAQTVMRDVLAGKDYKYEKREKEIKREKERENKEREKREEKLGEKEKGLGRRGEKVMEGRK
jgi:hypothetical protein